MKNQMDGGPGLLTKKRVADDVSMCARVWKVFCIPHSQKFWRETTWTKQQLWQGLMEGVGVRPRTQTPTRPKSGSTRSTGYLDARSVCYMAFVV